MFPSTKKILVCAGILLLPLAPSQAQTDPGPRGGAAGAGGPIAGLSANEGKFFKGGVDAFTEVDTAATGLGPRFNLNSCAGCHAQPATGGSSPASNPQVNGNVASNSQVNTLLGLSLISPNGPVREIRFKSDGGVHDLFTIVGLSGTPAGCNISQPKFSDHLSEIVFRTPTPVFGAGLMEAIPDDTILKNVGIRKDFGISGHENRNGNDGTLTRFGWKAQNKSLVIFAGEAYNVEQGVSNELFPDERGEAGNPDPDACYTVPFASDHTNYEDTQPQSVPSDVIAFANFMRFLAPPTPSCTIGKDCSKSVNNGSAQFASVGCAICHIPSLRTGSHDTAALRNKTANLFSDLLVHRMGTSLADGISQGAAGKDEFRTAPLWGLGQRIFFLHDGRTSDLLDVIQKHSSNGSEANGSIAAFNKLNKPDQQDLLNFLRSL